MKRKNGFALALCMITLLFPVPLQSADARKYEYDALNRVSKVQYEDGSTATYIYDANGNVKSVMTDITENDPSNQNEESGQNNKGGTDEKSGDDRQESTTSGNEVSGTDGGSGGNTAASGGGKTETGADDSTGKTENIGSMGNTGNTGKDETGGQQEEKEMLLPDKKPADKTADQTGGQADAGTGKAGSVSHSPDYTGKKVSKRTAGYQIIKDGKTREAVFLKAGKNRKTVKIPDTISYKGNRYKVTGIAPGACKGNTKLKKVTIGKYVETIGAKAFYGCKKLKKVTIKSKNLKKAGSKAFAGTHRKLVVRVPKNRVKTYQKLLKGKGMKKTAKVKK